MPFRLPNTPTHGKEPETFQVLDQIESDLSKYTLNEADIALQDPSTSSTSATGSASPEDEAYMRTSDTSSVYPLPPQISVANGLIHGHVHNFDNFTYIHGHIHTNDSLFDPLTYEHQLESSTQRTLRRRSSHHRHLNDLHSAEFTDCQHFEFLNCHDQQSKPVIVEDPNITCEEDENCKPKILEICCDNAHIQGEPFVPLFPDIGDVTKTAHQHFQSSSEDFSTHSFAHPNDDKTFEDCNFEDCIDVKCDLDSCDIDEDPSCKYCDNWDEFPDLKSSSPVIQSVLNGNSIPQGTNHTHTHAHSHDHLLSGHIHSHAHPESEITRMIVSSLPHHTQRVKREREDDEAFSTRPPNVLHHHLHHHVHHSHPENHHHHHIQLHDHQHEKKPKCEPSKADSLINFGWNFKNQQAKCEWDVCSSSFDNTLLLQTHIVENHLVPEFNIHNNTMNGSKSFDHVNPYECEWKNCNYTSEGMPALLSHINSQHSGYPTEDQPSTGKIQTSSSLTPSQDSQTTTEETTCKWIVSNEDGTTHLCGQHFENAETLTHHLVEDHVGSGQSIYFCMWDGCDRNGQEFRQRQKALRHLHTHTHYKPLQCHVCGRRFAVDTMLTQHMRTHSGEKPYQCTTCNKRFATSSSLSVHLRTHTGEKPLLCKYPGCGKRFSESSNLTKHMKIHEKEFKCDCCLRSFSTLKQLNSHNLKYHTEK